MSKQIDALKLALEALENNKQTHYYCEDNWYSCPQHEDGCANDSVGDECNCGADKANAKIDKAISAIKEALAQSEHEPVNSLPNEKTTDKWESSRIADYNSGWNDCRKTMLTSDTKPVLEIVNGQINRSWDAIPENFTGLLYTTQPQRTWVGLTDYQIEMTWFKHHDAEGYLRNPNQEGWAYEKELMAKLKEKNT